MAATDDDGLTPVRVHRGGGRIEAYAGAARRPSPVTANASARERSSPTWSGPAADGRTMAAAVGAPPGAAPATPARVRGPAIGLIVFCGAVLALMSMGTRNVLPLWQPSMLQDLGWTSFQFSVALAAQNLLWGGFSPFFGALADKFGSWRVLLFGAAMQICGLWVMSMASEPEVFFLSAGVMLGMAQAAGGMGIVLGAVGRAVGERRRTMAFGLITSASSAGMIVVTPIGRALLESMSWSEAFVGLSIVCLPMLLLAVFVRSRQEPGDPSTADIARLTLGQALGEAARHRGYVLLVVGFFVCGFHVTFIGVHLPQFLTSIGLGWQVGANALMIVGVFNVAACLAVGVVATTLSKKGVLAVIYLARAALFLAFISFPVTEWSVYLFAAALGVLWLSTVPPTQGIVAQVFGPQYMTMLFGIVFFGHQIGSFLGVVLGAKVFDLYGSYDLVWYACIALGLIATALHVLIDERPVARLRPRAAAAAAE